MKKQKLVDSINYNFELVGITSSVKEYKLAWSINRKLGLNLTRLDDHEISYAGREVFFTYFSDEPESGLFLRLFTNNPVSKGRATTTKLVPEFSHFDYILMREGESQSFSLKSLHNLLKEVQVIEYLAPLENKKIKNKEYFIF